MITKRCKWCNDEFTQPSRPARPKEYCCDEHRDKAKAKARPRKKKNKDDDKIIYIRPIDVMRKNGVSHDERKLLKARISPIQIKKEITERILKL